MLASTVKITHSHQDSGDTGGSADEEAEVRRRQVVLYEKRRWIDEPGQRIDSHTSGGGPQEISRLGAYQDWGEEENGRAVPAAEGDAWTVMSNTDHSHTLYLQAITRTHLIIHPDHDRLAGSWLRETRKDYDLTLKELAALVDVQTPTVHRWETGARKASKGHVRRLQEVFRQLWEATAHFYDMKLLDRQHLLHTDEPTANDKDYRSRWFVNDPDLALQLVLETRIRIPEPPWVTHLPKAWRIGYESADPEYWSQHARTIYSISNRHHL